MLADSCVIERVSQLHSGAGGMDIRCKNNTEYRSLSGLEGGDGAVIVQAGAGEFWVVEDIRFYQKSDGSIWLKFDRREMRMVPRQLDELGLESNQFHWEGLCQASCLEVSEEETSGRLDNE